MRYWLLKTEPQSYSWNDLWNEQGRTTHWDGVRNYQARNHMREMKVGDGILIYHSSCDPTAVVGVAEVVREANPDHTQFDPTHDHHDPKSRRDAPTWDMVDIRAREPFLEPVTLARLRAAPALAGMELLRKGSRLSVMPVREAEWKALLELGGVPNVPR